MHLLARGLHRRKSALYHGCVQRGCAVRGLQGNGRCGVAGRQPHGARRALQGAPVGQTLHGSIGAPTQRPVPVAHLHCRRDLAPQVLLHRHLLQQRAAGRQPRLRQRQRAAVGCMGGTHGAEWGAAHPKRELVQHALPAQAYSSAALPQQQAAPFRAPQAGGARSAAPHHQLPAGSAWETAAASAWAAPPAAGPPHPPPQQRPRRLPRCCAADAGTAGGAAGAAGRPACGAREGRAQRGKPCSRPHTGLACCKARLQPAPPAPRCKHMPPKPSQANPTHA